jgi:acyl dehydratase
MTGTAKHERWFEDYAIGQVEAGGSAVITASDIADFARLSHDDHPAHTDAEFATERFGGLLAHGVLSFAVVVGLTMEPNPRLVAYGYDRIRFPAPVLAGDTVVATAEVVDVGPHARNPGIGLVTKAYTGANQHGRTVLVCRHIVAVERRNPKEMT